MTVRDPMEWIAWRTAGKLLLLLHLEDVRLDCLGTSQRYRDHDILAGYGYRMADCECVPERQKVEVWNG